MRATLFPLFVLALGGCAGPRPDDAPSAEVSASVEELGKMNRDFAAALLARDGKAAAALYAEDAMLIPPGEPVVKGRAAIEAYWQGAIDNAGIEGVTVETIEAKSSGSLGYEVGRFSMTVTGPDGALVTERGRYTELLRREADGTWRSTLGIWNAEPE